MSDAVSNETTSPPRKASLRAPISDSKARPARRAPLPDALAYSVKDACHVTGIGRTKLYELIATGKLKTTRSMGRVLVLGDSLRALLSS